MAIAVLLGSMAFINAAAAGECDPDFKGKDRITKKEVVQWHQVLTASGILSAALLEKDITFTAYVARAGDKNVVGISVTKIEENLARAAFETQFRASKGDEILLGFKSGDPVTFVTTRPGNNAQSTLMGKLNLSANWEAEVSDAEMAGYRDALTRQVVDAIRITASSGQIDRAVPEKNGQRLREKFGCFFRMLNDAGASMADAGGVPEGSGATAETRTPATSSALEAAVRSTANCRSNFDVSGSMVRGTSYETFDEYPLNYEAGLAAVQAAIVRESLTVESTEPHSGTIVAAGTNAAGKSLRYKFTVVPAGREVRVTLEQDLRVGKHGSDNAIRDEMCKILSSIAEATAKAERVKPAPPPRAVSAAPPSPTSIEPAPKATAPAGGIEERLRQLEELFKKGLVTEEEYKKKRAQILSSI